MTRKDYKLIAEAIKTTRYQLELPSDDKTLSLLIDNLSIQLRQDNRNFDYSRFAEACGKEV